MKFGKNRRSRLTTVAAAVLSVGLFAAACGGGGTGSGDGGSGSSKPPITIGYINWNEDVALTYLWQHLLTERGYEVELNKMKASLLFKAMTTGEIDVFFDTWLPTTHKKKWEKFGDQLEKLTKWYDKAPLDLAVPTYTYKNGVKSIGDLDNHAELFDGKITGIGAGAGESSMIKNKIIPAYNIGDKITYQASSTGTMLKALKEALNNHKPIVVALWQPHWAWDEFNIKPLKDPKNAWGEPDSIYVTARGENSKKGSFSKDYPKVSSWISKMHLTPKQISSLSNAVVNNAKTAEERKKAAAEWASKHQELIHKWVPKSTG